MNTTPDPIDPPVAVLGMDGLDPTPAAPVTEHEPPPWKLGGCSGRMITTPSGYVGDGFIADVDTLANAKRIILAVNSYDAMHARLAAVKALCGEIKRKDESELDELDGPLLANRILAVLEEGR